MDFYLANGRLTGEGARVVLYKDDWNDWFKWVTQFKLVFHPREDEEVIIGSLKIGRLGMTEGDGVVSIPTAFNQLPEEYFSLGQSENFYETIAQLGDATAHEIFLALNDCAYDLSIYEKARDEAVMLNSLTRDIPIDQIRTRFHQLARGSAILSSYHFKYSFPKETAIAQSPILSFEVYPNSAPPTNIHVLIGRNGVGKTRCFRLMSEALLSLTESEETGSIERLDLRAHLEQDERWFSGLINVSFSAFDATTQIEQTKESNIKYSYIGLKKIVREESLTRTIIKGSNELNADFVEAAGLCREGARFKRWQTALRTLETDPLFQEADVSSLGRDIDSTWEESAIRLFKNLSSGHGIVLLTITKLIALVEERTLVLIDEPEGHLHPPLLSAFVRALSDLLINRNGVAIVATHSPVVLQEVPASCVWMLSRSGRAARADRPEIETFGENVGVLTREVFGLEVTQSGFHKLIADYAETGRNYNEIIEYFDKKVGAEGRALARALTSNKN